MSEQIVSEKKAGLSAFVRALAHIIDDTPSDSKADFEKAHMHFGKAISLMRNLDDPKHLGFVYGLRGSVGLLWNTISQEFSLEISQESSLERVTEDLEKSGELLPIETTYMLLGYTYWKRDMTDIALQRLEKAIDIKTDYAAAYLLKGRIHQERREADLAHEDIYWAISLNPDLYDEQFEPIMQAEREAEAYFDELERQPEFQAEMRKREKNI